MNLPLPQNSTRLSLTMILRRQNKKHSSWWAIFWMRTNTQKDRSRQMNVSCKWNVSGTLQIAQVSNLNINDIATQTHANWQTKGTILLDNMQYIAKRLQFAREKLRTAFYQARPMVMPWLQKTWQLLIALTTGLVYLPPPIPYSPLSC